MGLISIEGKKIRLRDWLREDVKPFKHWQRPGMKWQAFDGPYYRSSVDESEEIAAELASRIEKAEFQNPRRRLVIAEAKTNKLIGTVSSYWESKETNWLCAGITIFDPSMWRVGIGYEALGLWIDFLFQNHPEIVRLDMRTWSGNEGLIRLAKKLGFIQEACFRNARIFKGKYFDGLGFGILRDEWSELNPRGFAVHFREQ